MSYVPPHIRNKQQATSESTPTDMARINPFQRDRRPPRRPYEKPFWQVEKERAEAEAEALLEKNRRGMENTEENFPALCAPTTKTAIWSGQRKFTDLVSEWKETDDKQKEQAEIEKKRSEKDEYSSSTFVLPCFRNIRRFEEPEDVKYVEEITEVNNTEQTEDSGWITVERKSRKVKHEKTFQELDEEYQRDMAEFNVNRDETVWGEGDAQEHETCWDEHRH